MTQCARRAVGRAHCDAHEQQRLIGAEPEEVPYRSLLRIRPRAGAPAACAAAASSSAVTPAPAPALGGIVPHDERVGVKLLLELQRVALQPLPVEGGIPEKRRAAPLAKHVRAFDDELGNQRC
jgi:hypothetical protein